MNVVADAARRHVVVLGRAPVLDPGEAAGRAASEGIALVFLSVGYPVTAQQAVLVEEGARLADELRVSFDALLVESTKHLLDHIEDGDDLTVAASGRERRHLEAVLSRGISLGERTR